MKAKAQPSDAGFTLVEVILVIVIVSILLAVAVPKFINLIDVHVDRSRCAAERGAINSALSVTYAAITIRDPSQADWLQRATMANVSDTMFATGHTPICPDNGTFSVTDGQAICSIHGR